MNQLQIGAAVRNFGQVAKVVGFHEITGDPILQGFSGERWLADPALCEPIEAAPAPLRHKDGLLCLG
jgi:hypothetical protein